ncbi:MAG: D-tyrosyl-tRNA(Tyr) deacylase [Chloroflexi bacterium]|nr:D-tyrosyl-tRNA(Tyr) deacylase [Chloroflexota bacterium]
MRALIQRVSQASVSVDGRQLGTIGAGLVVLLGIHSSDGTHELAWMAEKIVNLRIFSDDEGRFNRSLLDVGGEVLLISQFTLYGDARRGRRPSFSDAAAPELAAPLVDQMAIALRQAGVVKVACGQFGAHMQVALVNDGPVTLMLDSAVTRSINIREP